MLFQRIQKGAQGAAAFIQPVLPGWHRLRRDLGYNNTNKRSQ
jgi:hypothetical protein